MVDRVAFVEMNSTLKNNMIVVRILTQKNFSRVTLNCRLRIAGRSAVSIEVTRLSSSAKSPRPEPRIMEVLIFTSPNFFLIGSKIFLIIQSIHQSINPAIVAVNKFANVPPATALKPSEAKSFLLSGASGEMPPI